MYILTIDFGTTNLKAFLWNKEGKIIFRKIVFTPLNEDYSISPFFLKKYIEDIFKDLGNKIRKIKGISVSGMGEAGLLIDSYGNPLTNIFSWLDMRGDREIKILENIGRDRIFEITGLKISPKYSLAKILWIRENLKEIWMKRYKWLNVIDYINYLLTGRIMTDYTLANRMLLFDIKNKNWSSEILNLCDLDISLLPDIYPAGSIVGELSFYFQKEFSIPSIPVVLGGHDHPIASIPLFLDSKTLLDSWGTAEALLLSTNYPLLRKEIGEKGFSVGYIFENSYYLIAGIHFSGGIKKWLKENLKWSIPKYYNKPTNIFFFPYIMGRNITLPNPHLKGIFYGIDINTKILDLKKAIWEGVFYETKIIIEEIHKIGFNIEKIITVGGMVRYKNLLKLKSDVLNIPILISKEKELTSKGSAYLVAKNIFPKDIWNNFLDEKYDIILPSENNKLYVEKFNKYKELQNKFFG